MISDETMEAARAALARAYERPGDVGLRLSVCGAPPGTLAPDDTAEVVWGRAMAWFGARPPHLLALLRQAAGERPEHASELFAVCDAVEREVGARPRRTPPTRDDLQRALLDAFPTRFELTELMRHEFGESLDELVGPGNLVEAAGAVVAWATARDRVCELMRRVFELRRNQPQVAAVWEGLRERCEDR